MLKSVEAPMELINIDTYFARSNIKLWLLVNNKNYLFNIQ